MGFLFGLMIGGMAASGGGAPALNFGTIPFRCLSAFSVSEADYRGCRVMSLTNDLYQAGCDRERRDAVSGGCSIEQNMKWEITGLRDLKAAMDAKH